MYYKIGTITFMIYIICALSAEARLFLDQYKLKQYTNLPFKIYKSEKVKLIVSGVGHNNALLATTALLAHFIPSKDDILINIGVAAAPKKFELNSLVIGHKINYKERSYYPDVLFSHRFKEANITTVDEPQEAEHTHIVDMEASAVFQAASRFMQTHQLIFMKIISDHFEPESVTKELILKSLQTNRDNIFELIEQISTVEIKSSSFSDRELEIIKEHEKIFTKSQFQQFIDACHFYQLKHKKVLPIKVQKEINSKKIRGEYLQDVIKQLTN